MTTAPPPAPPPASSSSASASSLSKVCFNTECKELKSDIPKKGWRLRTGEFAELCDRCGYTFEEGRFCETFHSNASGWRSCESCGKLIHCGCIVSSHTFMLLDPGGIECFTCARKNLVMPSNPVWPSSFFFQSSFSERLKDLSVKSWSQLAGSGPVPWKQAPTLFNSSFNSSEVHPRAPYELDISNGAAKLNSNGRLPISPLEKKIEDLSERSMNGSAKLGAHDLATINGMKSEDKINSCLSTSQQSTSLKENLSASIVLTAPNATANERNGQIRMAGTLPQSAPSPSQVKQYNGDIYNGHDASGENHNRSGRPRMEARGRNQLLPRYWPRCTDQEKQQICREPNSDLTPLFQKTLSASDAGRIGRLVLPKKCAEAYFPPISQPEGLPLKILDMEGKEWVFQFRFWPNNNSRMYVLEGVTPCIQSMQLQAGDTVTFSRLEPGGKLVMGFRKASNVSPSDQDTETKRGGSAANGDADLVDPSSWSKVDKSGYIAKEVPGTKSSVSRKRKSGILGLKSKKLRIEDEDLIELKITWEEAQGLLRPPPNIPSIVVIEGFEFEEYEDAPVIGKPTIFTTDDVGEKVQWVQCEDCLKWRKVPANAILPLRWTCSDNSTDPQRSLCSSVQELTTEQLEDLLTHCNSAPLKKTKAAKHDPDNVEALEGLDTLANLAILGEGETLPASAQATTKHPRHRPGCTCIVCIQPPSGKGPKHKQSCTCNVCLTVKRRFRTLMLRREKKQSEKDAESSRKKQEEEHPPESVPDNMLDDDAIFCVDTRDNSQNDNKEVNDSSEDDPCRTKSSSSPFKGQIDLNIQPEREEELSPSSDSGSMMKLLQDATERYLREQRVSGGTGDSSNCQSQVVEGGAGEEKFNNSIGGNKNCDTGEDKGSSLPIKVAASS